MNREKFSVGSTVIHFKHELSKSSKMKYMYVIIGYALNTETEEQMVIYKSLWNGELYARPYDMFMSEVDRSKYPDIKQKYRFEIMNCY